MAISTFHPGYFHSPGRGGRSRSEVARVCRLEVCLMSLVGGRVYGGGLFPSPQLPFLLLSVFFSPIPLSRCFLHLSSFCFLWCPGVVWEECEIFSAKLKLTNWFYLTSSSSFIW